MPRVMIDPYCFLQMKTAADACVLYDIRKEKA